MRPADAARFGLSVQDIAVAVNTALLGQVASSVLEGDRIVNVRVLANPANVNRIAALQELPLRMASGMVVRLAQVADMSEESSEVELVRDDLRQDIIVSARLEGRDLGSAMKEIQDKLSLGKNGCHPAREGGGGGGGGGGGVCVSNMAVFTSSSRNPFATS